MRQSHLLARYRSSGRAEFLAAVPKNEIDRGFKARALEEPKSAEDKLLELAERIRNEGPVPVSDILKAKLAAKPKAGADI